MLQAFTEFWNALPSFGLIAIGVISFLSGFWQNAFSEWEVKYRRTFRIGGVVIGIFLIMAGISDYQQNKERVTKNDLKQSADHILMDLNSALAKKLDKLPEQIESKKEKPYKHKAKELLFSVNGKNLTSFRGNRERSFSDPPKVYGPNLQLSMKNASDHSVLEFMLSIEVKDCDLKSNSWSWTHADLTDHPGTGALAIQSKSILDGKLNPMVEAVLPDIRVLCGTTGERHLIIRLSLNNERPLFYGATYIGN